MTGLRWGAGLAMVICCFLYFRYIVPYHVCLKEQIQLFVYSSSYILSYFSKPAFLACLGGDFLTQFFYFKSGGAAVATLLLTLEWLLVFQVLKRFSVERYALLWSLLPVLVEWIIFPQISFPVALSVSFILALSAFLVYAKTGGKIAIAVGLILIPILYVTAGMSVFLFLILVILYNIHRMKSEKTAPHTSFLLLAIYFFILTALSIALPFLLRHTYLVTLKEAYLFPYPDIKQGASLVALVIIVVLFVCFKKLRGQNSGILYFTVSLLLLVCLSVAGFLKMTSKDQENLYGLTIESYYEHWDKVLEIAEKAQLKNSIAACYTNIALSNKSLLGERLMDFYQPFSLGLLPMIPHTGGWLVLFAGSDAFYHVGDIDMAQHAAMLGMIFSPNQRNARMAERLVETNMANGDIQAAMKYRRMLESTLFHKKKAGQLESQPHQKVVKKDILRKSTDIRISLELLTENDTTNLRAVNYLLCYYLLTKDIPAFFDAYVSYFQGKYRPVPKVYAEALLIYLVAKKYSVEEVAQFRIPPEIIKAFSEYTRLYERSHGNIAPLQEKFPNTYWLYYHFAIMNK